MYNILLAFTFILFILVFSGLIVLWKKINLELRARDEILGSIVQDLTKITAAIIGVTRLIEHMSMKVLEEDKKVDKKEKVE